MQRVCGHMERAQHVNKRISTRRSSNGARGTSGVRFRRDLKLEFRPEERNTVMISEIDFKYFCRNDSANDAYVYGEKVFNLPE